MRALCELDHKPAFLTLHGRTATQRYGKAASWDAIEAAAALAAEYGVPVVGNGDVLTHYDARARRAAAPTSQNVMCGFEAARRLLDARSE